MDSFIPTMKVGSFNRRTSCTARSTSGYLRQYAGTWSAGRRGSRDGGAPVQLLHDFPGDIRLGHVLKLRVRSELLLCNFVHARKEGRHPFLQDSQRGRGKLSTHRLRAETSGTHTLSKFLQQLPPEAVELARLLEPGTPERTINV